MNEVERLANTIGNAYETVRKNQTAMAKKNALYRDAKLRDGIKYDVHDPVYYWDPAAADERRGVPSKYRRKWSGPHILEERKGHRWFNMRRADNNKLVRVNVNRLQPC
jgi:hypothetical protein